MSSIVVSNLDALIQRVTEAVQAADQTTLGVAVVAAPVLGAAVWWIASYLASPLRKYPGPALAGKLLTTLPSRSIMKMVCK